jgi:hypothetical protein
MAKKVEIKTSRTNASVTAFISSVKDPEVRKDVRTIAALMKKATQSKPAMWGASIVGFGSVTLHYSTGRELDWMLCGFSPRKQALTLYLSTGFPFNESLMKKLGKHKHGMGCLYIKSLNDVDLKVLEQIIAASVATMKKMYGAKR